MSTPKGVDGKVAIVTGSGLGLGRAYAEALAAAGAVVQGIGVGGDKLSMWSCPTEVSSAFRDGDWGDQTIAAAWSTTVGFSAQGHGIELPPLDSVEGAESAE